MSHWQASEGAYGTMPDLSQPRFGHADNLSTLGPDLVALPANPA